MKYEIIERQLVNWEALPDSATVFDFDHTSPDATKQCLEAVTARTYDRVAIPDILAGYNRTIGNDGKALANIELLRQPLTTVVVTGQQAGLFTGPLYTIYKAITAILLAERESARLGTPVVPIFWNATEDHDLSEIAFCSMPGKRWEAEFGAKGVAAEALAARPAITETIEQFTAALPELHRSELVKLISCDTSDYGIYSSSVLARIFAGTGLIIIEPYLLRPLNTDFLQDCVRKRDNIRSALLSGAKVLEDAGLPPSFTVTNGFGLFHIAEDGKRGQVLQSGEHFQVGAESLREADLLSCIAERPEAFSTGAYLRPVLQSLCLPNLAFIAGPGEIRYHMQLREVYRCFDALIPVIRPRNHATLLDAREKRTVEKLGLTHDDLFRGAEAFRQPVELPTSEAPPFAEAERLLQDAADVLMRDVAELTGDRSISTFHHKVKSELAKVRKRAAREFQRRSDVDNARIDRLFQSVLPGGTLQERQINVFHYLGQAGPGLIGELLDVFDPYEERHYICSIAE